MLCDGGADVAALQNGFHLGTPQQVQTVGQKHMSGVPICGPLVLLTPLSKLLSAMCPLSTDHVTNAQSPLES